MADPIRIEIVYADERRQMVKKLECSPPLSVAQALALIATDANWADIEIQTAAVGVFGRIVPRERLLCDGERLEIYVPLKTDPKSVRRARAMRKR